MRKSILFILGTMLLFAACNREITHPYRSVDEAISFDTYAAGVTRTVALSTSSLTVFGAAAYTGSVQVMDNQLVSGGNGSWTYSPVKYWPQSGPLYFSAYAPYATASNGITPAYNTTTRTIDLSYALPAAEADQVDLLMAANVNVADCSADRPAAVQFTFGHILSRIGLTARYTGTVSSGTTVTLTDVKISGNFVESGDYTVSGGWDNRAASATDLVYDRPAAKLAATALTTSAQNLLAGDNYVMVIPNESEVEVNGTITVYYTVTTSDGVSIDYVKDASSPLAYEPNKTYTYNLIIDVDSDAITFGDVTVSDWGTEVSMDVDVHSYSNSLSVTGLSFTPTKRTVQYEVTSIKEFANGSVTQVPWQAEFSIDGGNTYSSTLPDFFDEFTAFGIGSGTFSASTSKAVGESVYVRFKQIITSEQETADETIVKAKIVTYPLTFDIISNGYIKWIATSSSGCKTISYKLNDNDWIDITSTVSESSTPIINVSAGDVIQFKGENVSYYYNNSGYSYFKGTASFNIRGNIMSLIFGDGYIDQCLLPDNSTYNFYSLFRDCPVHSAEQLELPATTLSEGCYANMFLRCTSLIQAPALPATILAVSCYNSMFEDCSNLISSPFLPAITLSKRCYYEMFRNCTGLTTVSNLPAQYLEEYCYYGMFDGCTRLTNPPLIYATNAAQHSCQLMFNNCISLISAPELPATSLAEGCYMQMFYNCTSLESAPELPATSLAQSCYQGMFHNCSSLISAPEELPALNLLPFCYYHMFNGCSSLVIAPRLPAQTLVSSCYKNMFYNCSSLKAITCLATNVPDSIGSYFENWTTGVNSTGTLTKANSVATSKWTNKIPSGWVIQNAQ